MDDTITQGDTVEWSMTFLDGAGAPIDLSGCTVWMTAKTAADTDPTDAEAPIKHYLVVDEEGVTESALGLSLGGWDLTQEPPVFSLLATSGVVTQTLTSTESAALELGTLIFDVQIKLASGRVETPINGGRITTVSDITNRETTP